MELAAGDAFRVQAEIAEKVAGALEVTLLDPERERLAAAPTENQEAYEYYLRGIDYYDRSLEEQAFLIAIQMYQKAVELDPDFADVPIVTERRDDVVVNCVMSNSFGFGGTNATLVFKRYDA